MTTPRHPQRLLRVMTLNLWHRTEPWERRRELIVAGLSRLQPDLVGLQEAFDDPETGYNQAREIAAREGYHVRYEASGPLGRGSIGNAVLSRYPIVGSEARTLPFGDGTLTRIALRADVALFEGTLRFFCVHLSYRADEGYKREAQVAALDRFVREAPRDLPRIVVGDFNADPDSNEIRFFTGKGSIAGRSTFYHDAGAERGGGLPTWAERNPGTEVFHEGNRRIDYVFVSHARPDGSGAVASCEVILDAPDADGTFASDHFGVHAAIRIGRPVDR